MVKGRIGATSDHEVSLNHLPWEIKSGKPAPPHTYDFGLLDGTINKENRFTQMFISVKSAEVPAGVSPSLME